MKKEKIDENFAGALKTIGSSVFSALKPSLKKVAGDTGKKAFRKAAKAGIKKFGKKNVKTAWNFAKNIASDKKVQDASKEIAKDITDWGKNKIKNSFKKKQKIQKPQEELVESFGLLVNDAICNEAWGALIKGGVTAAKGVAKGVGKNGLKMTNGKMLKNVGSSIANDLKQTASDAYDATPLGAIQHTFKDENGNWSFNPFRGMKKHYKGLVKTADNIFTGGLGQMAYNAATSKEEEEEYKTQYVLKPFASGGLPDLAGGANAKYPWETPKHYKGKAYKFYSVVVVPYQNNLDGEYNPGEESVVFFKAPAVMDKSKVEEKLIIYLRDYFGLQDVPDNISILRNISLINQVAKNVYPLSKWEKLTGNKFEANKGMPAPSKSVKETPKTKNREEITEEIKAKAKALAKEKMKVLISNGVSKEDALSAAKAAYQKFIKDFYNKSSLNISASSRGIAGSRNADNPLMHKGLRDQMLNASKNEAKRKAAERYKELIARGWSEAAAKKEALKDYNRKYNK